MEEPNGNSKCSGSTQQMRLLEILEENATSIKVFIRQRLPHGWELNDIYQTIYLRILDAEIRDNIANPKAYLYSIARNVINDEFRKSQRSIIEYHESNFACLDNNQQGHIDNSNFQHDLLIVSKTITDLPERNRRALIFIKLMGYSYKDASEKLGVSISYTEKLVATAIRSCRESIAVRN